MMNDVWWEEGGREGGRERGSGGEGRGGGTQNGCTNITHKLLILLYMYLHNCHMHSVINTKLVSSEVILVLSHHYLFCVQR